MITAGPREKKGRDGAEERRCFSCNSNPAGDQFVKTYSVFHLCTHMNLPARKRKNHITVQLQYSKKTISNTLRRHGLKSCSARKVPLLKPAQERMSRPV